MEITSVTKPTDMHFVQDVAYSLTASGLNMFSVEVTNNGPVVIESVLGAGTSCPFDVLSINVSLLIF